MKPTGPGSRPPGPRARAPAAHQARPAAGRSPPSGPPALAAASSCASASSRTSRHALRSLITAVRSAASLRGQPLGAPGSRALASRPKREGRQKTPQEVLASDGLGAGKPPAGQSQPDWGRGPRAPRCVSEPHGAALRTRAPPRPPPRAPRLARLKLRALT